MGTTIMGPLLLTLNALNVPHLLKAVGSRDSGLGLYSAE